MRYKITVEYEGTHLVGWQKQKDGASAQEFLEKANIREWEKVEILDVNNGERFQTYALKGKRGSKCFCLNGAAARKVQKGDKIIIVTYAQMTEEEIKTHKPTILQIGENNEILSYGK